MGRGSEKNFLVAWSGVPLALDINCWKLRMVLTLRSEFRFGYDGFQAVLELRAHFC